VSRRAQHGARLGGERALELAVAEPRSSSAGSSRAIRLRVSSATAAAQVASAMPVRPDASTAAISSAPARAWVAA
jgi:hypothetical protein